MELFAREEMWGFVFVQALVAVIVGAIFVIAGFAQRVEETCLLDIARVWAVNVAMFARRWRIAGRVRTQRSRAATMIRLFLLTCLYTCRRSFLPTYVTRHKQQATSCLACVQPLVLPS